MIKWVKKLVDEGQKTKTVESQLFIESIVVQIKETNKPASKIQLARRKRCCFDQAIPSKQNFEKFQVRPYRISVCKTLGFIYTNRFPRECFSKQAIQAMKL